MFKTVFEDKRNKEDSRKEIQDLFQDKTDEIINFLWTTTEKVYGSGSNDLLEEIYKDKGDSNKFPSQIVNPNENQSKSSKPLFNSAIDRVKEDRNYKQHRSRNRHDYGSGGSRDYNNSSSDRRNDNYRDDRRNRKSRDESFRTVHRGDKTILIRNKKESSRSRSRSRSRDKDRERSRDDEGSYNQQGKEHYEQRGEREHYGGGEYYPTYQRGYYPMRRFGRGRYARYMQPRFVDPRR